MDGGTAQGAPSGYAPGTGDGVSEALWSQFRRLLLGTVVEALLAERLPVAFGSIRIAFEDESAFRVPRLDNYMRFRGALSATLETDPPPERVEALDRRLRAVWPELLSVVDLPIGDRLTSSRHEIAVRVTGRDLQVVFDLEAD